MKADSNDIRFNQGKSALIPAKAGALLLNSLSRKQHYSHAARPFYFDRRKTAGQPLVREKREHFCQLRPGTKRVLQWRAYLAAVLLAGSLGSGSASADDEALYGPAAPPGSAFVRVFNPTSDDGLQGRIADKTFRAIDAYAVSEFVFLPPGQYTLTAGTASESLSLKQNRYYTAVPVGKDFKVFDNDGTLNRLKALVILYNLTEQPVTLQTAQGTPVIDNVAPEKSGERAVNAVKTTLALASGGTKVSDVKPINLTRGKVFSLFVLPAGDQPQPVWAMGPSS